ncbi:MAG: PD-(D/E)XK nuclease family protein [Bdellovibrionales bacterium]|nr:PD-(D/E)XK nuclease family protein [Bdellovibrionales bacterium]
MLKIIKTKDSSDTLNFFNTFHPKDSIFISSDIKNKIFLERELLKHYDFLLGPCVLRANEFYKEIFTILNKTWNLRSDFYVKQLFSEFLKSRNYQYLIPSKSFFESFDLCLIVFLENSYSVFKEWFFSQKQFLFPKDWLDLFSAFFQELKSQNILPESSVKALVWHYSSDFDSLHFQKENLIVDLAFSMDLCEKDIFSELSKYKNVYVISPELETYSMFEKEGYDFYLEWEREIKKENCISITKSKELPSRSFFKLENITQQEEVKQATAQVSQWLKQGISFEDITIYAARMEDYWFALKSDLSRESIPCKKTSYSSLIDFPEIKYILSALRLHLNDFTFEDLELFCFYKDFGKDFSEFKSNYFDVPKRKIVQKHLFQDKLREAKKKVSGFDFIGWLLSFWKSDFSDILLQALFKILNKLSTKELLQYRSWLSLLESEIFLEELEEKEEQIGISCLSFNAFHSVKSSYVILLGLTESVFKENSFLQRGLTQALVNDLGFPLKVKQSREREKSVLWFLQNSGLKEVYLSFCLYDFKGNIQNKSLIYRLSNMIYSAKEKEKSNRLSYEFYHRQKLIKDILKFKNKKQVKAIELAFKSPVKVFTFKDQKMSLSASQIQTYNNCPFKYAGEKLFHVKEKVKINQELSALIKGLTVHSLFQLILEKYPDLNLNDKQKEDLIQHVLPDQKYFVHEEQIIIIKEDLKNLLEQFLLKENMQKKDFPCIKPMAFELKLKAFWNQKESQLSSKGDYPFQGKIDRVDISKKKDFYIVRDYKASGNKLTHISNWIENNQFQLLFYAQALQKKLVETSLLEEVKEVKILATFYSIYNEDFKAKGFIEKGSVLENFVGKKGKQNQKADFFEEIISQVNEKTKEIVSKIKQGQFAPQPRKKSLCETCYYKTWCRFEDSNVS